MPEEKIDNRILPCVALRANCPLPNNKIRFDVGRTKSVEAIIACEKEFHKEIILVVQKDIKVEDPKLNDIQPYGVFGKLDFKLRKDEEGIYRVLVNTTKRVKITNLLNDGPFSAVSYEEVDDTITNQDEVQATMNLITHEVNTKGKQLLEDSDLNDLKKITTPIEYSNFLMYHLQVASDSDKYNFLSNLDFAKRLKLLLLTIKKHTLINELEKKISKDVEESLMQNQKEYFLREKIRAIQDELGDRTTREDDAEKFKKRMEEAQMPEDIKQHLTDEINRYLATSAMSQEANIIRNYLDFATSLPWSKMTIDCSDIKKVEKVLNKNHYGLKKPKERILEYLSVQIKAKKNPQTIICLVGPPGVGKTSLAFSIAEALERKFVKQSLGGIRDEAEIRGHRKTYVGAMPGRILKGMQSAGTMNPVFLLDEIDKISASYMGDPASALLEVLDPEQNFRFSDNYLEESYDLSKVMFITTANYLENIPEPLRDRMEIIYLSSYSEHEKVHIAREHLIPKVLKEHGLEKNELVIPDEIIYYIIRYYTREAGVRELDRLLASIARKSIKEQLEKKTTSAEIDKKIVNKYLGKEIFSHNIIDETDEYGIVTGLAYTQYGGDTLKIEATCYPGKGGLNITGKLGEVMKESVATAFSYIKSIAQSHKINQDIFTTNDFHIHVPEGAVPKDGPSAGITLATAIYSLVTKSKVNRMVGMTGEITLRGTILPIGGLKEKAIAAHRSGLKKILIPIENKKDLDDIPSEVKKELEIIAVKSLDEVLKHALVK